MILFFGILSGKPWLIFVCAWPITIYIISKWMDYEEEKRIVKERSERACQEEMNKKSNVNEKVSRTAKEEKESKPREVEHNIVEFQSDLPVIKKGQFKDIDAKNVVIPEGVQIIEAEAFYMSENLKKITIPSSVIEIGESAFAKCPELEEVILSNGLKTIRQCAFMLCKKLRKINIPSTVETIEKHAFAYCEQLQIPSVPPTTHVAEFAFIGCKKQSQKVTPKKNSVKLPRFRGPRTISESCHYYGHDFERTSIELVLENGKYYLVSTYDPFPGGMGKIKYGRKILVPQNMLYKSDSELEFFYKSKTF